MQTILGISAYYHDSAAVLLVNGEIVAAAQEERFTRKKHDESFPINSIRFCLETLKLDASAIDAVVFYEKPFLKFERILETYLRFAPIGFNSFRKFIPQWIGGKIFQKQELLNSFAEIDSSVDWRKKLIFSEHHLSHAASAFFASPFQEALVLTLDGVGEYATTSVAIGRGNSLEIVKEIHFPSSIGLLYSAFTYFLGFKVNSGEYKVMGLAPYGKPKYADTILSELVGQKEDGSFHLNLKYFDYCVGEKMTNDHFSKLFQMKKREPEEVLTQEHMDLAASVQSALETIVLNILKPLKAEFQLENLCLAGGVALNCVANGRIIREKLFKNLWVQPAAGDAGGALGAALVAHHLYFGNSRAEKLTKDKMRGNYLGPSFSNEEVISRLKALGAVFHSLNQTEILDQSVTSLMNGKILAWHKGSMEFGPRSLGARSILADARSSTMQKTLNIKTKNRESFRPFAPAILSECCSDWFNLSIDSPYMLIVSELLEKHRLQTAEEKFAVGLDRLKIQRSVVPAVTHVDYSARIQTVHPETNPAFYSLLKLFYERTGVPILVNTSFNVRGEPIVCTPEDSYRCFMGTEIDVLVIEDNILFKEEQPFVNRSNYMNSFELD